ncbi:MAG: hypothetical protein AB7J35_11200 [Dehalococcoidia bacterium]
MNTRLKVGTILAGAALAATSFAGAASAAGTNLLNNGALMPTTAGWAKIGEGTFTSAHFAGATLINTKDSMKESSVAAYQCVSLPDNWTYTLKGTLRVAPDQERTGSAYVLASYFEKAGCSGANIDLHESEHFAETNGWTDITMKLHRTNGKKAKSMAVALFAEKDSTNRMMKKNKPFVAQFKNFELTGDAPSGGPFSCPPDCGESSEEPPAPPVPPKDDPAPKPPVLQPKEPVVPDDETPVVEPVTPGDDQPAEDPADTSGTPGATGDDQLDGDDANPGTTNDEPAGVPSMDEPGPGSQPDDADTASPAKGEDGDPSDGTPAEHPTLEPQAPGGPFNSATPTPPPPATGGDNPLDPPGDFDSHDSQSDAARNASQDDAGLPMGLMSVLGIGGLGLLGIVGVAVRHKKRD